MPWSRDRSFVPFALSVLFIVAATLLVVVIAEGPATELNPVDNGAAASIDHGSEIDPTAVHDPYTAGQQLPEGYRQLLPRDFIRPVYQPRFTTAGDIDWPDDADVIGVTIEGEAKAYPVSFLNGREMVVDELGGEPLLVSW
jgi:hypothetical protein